MGGGQAWGRAARRAGAEAWERAAQNLLGEAGGGTTHECSLQAREQAPVSQGTSVTKQKFKR